MLLLIDLSKKNFDCDCLWAF